MHGAPGSRCGQAKEHGRAIEAVSCRLTRDDRDVRSIATCVTTTAQTAGAGDNATVAAIRPGT